MTLSRWLRILLWPASKLYGVGVSIRARFYASGLLKQKRLNAAVISVGNLRFGGTGKTPLVIWLAEKLLAQGHRVAVLTRGYRGTAGSSDEVELMRSRLKNRVIFGVGKNRFAEGRRIESHQAIDIFLLDDGFQHLELARDLDIVLIDASRPMAQSLLPAGPMREPLSALTRAGIIIFTRAENTAGAKEAIQRLSNLPIFAASTRLLGFRRIGSEVGSLQNLADLGSGPFFAFCGIGNPEAFERDLQRWGIMPAGHVFLADHHRYTLEDVQAIERAAATVGAKSLLTTEKDSWNLKDVHFRALPVFVSVIDLEITGEAEFLAAVNGAFQARGGQA
ncbi:MAG: tetraacyldisaccharide 4-kinase [Acidobacteriaceae bacterium]|jgi:tetraacyldisaccharide 4'-kinase|nr:tetraacyldisaccharide 4-kinase [Acidobacteriaceae bacterium]